MLDRAHRLSSSWTHFSDECDRLKTGLRPAAAFITISRDRWHDSSGFTIQRQISADIVRKQLKDVSLKVHTTIQPVFVSRKIEQELSVKETKAPIVNQQCVVYGFQSHFGTHDHAIDLIKVIVCEWKTVERRELSVYASSARRSSVSKLGSSV